MTFKKSFCQAAAAEPWPCPRDVCGQFFVSRGEGGAGSGGRGGEKEEKVTRSDDGHTGDGGRGGFILAAAAAAAALVVEAVAAHCDIGSFRNRDSTKMRSSYCWASPTPTRRPVLPQGLTAIGIHLQE